MSYHATASPQGDALAYIDLGTLYVQKFSQGESPLPCLSENQNPPPTRPAKVAAVKWSGDGSRVAVILEQKIEIYDIQSRTCQATLRNGSGGLGRFATADFFSSDRLLVIWEFGKAKIWSLNDEHTFDLPDAKLIGNGRTWAFRPVPEARTRAYAVETRILAMITRNAGEDQLLLHFSPSDVLRPLGKLPTADAQSLTWSHDGAWLAVLDSPSLSKNLHIYTADGCFYHSCGRSESLIEGLGLQIMSWSPDSRFLAAADYESRVTLLRMGTFTMYSVLEHHSTIEQGLLPLSQQASIWQENASATNVRSYTSLSSPVSPPISRSKASIEPGELGVAEMAWNSEGKLLATCDTRMLNTVWIWDMDAMALRTVLIQHNDVRKLQWHSELPAMLLIDCVEDIVYVFDAHSDAPPLPMKSGLRPTAACSWVPTISGADPLILVTERTKFRILTTGGEILSDQLCLPSGATTATHSKTNIFVAKDDDSVEEAEDSLFDILSGRKPLHPKTERSYTEMIDLEAEANGLGSHAELDDTFREKKKAIQRAPDPDPLDDSQIF